ncbi:MAG: hypothetical protein ABI444_02475 [Candidatus Kapaibacterium sp.]
MGITAIAAILVDVIIIFSYKQINFKLRQHCASSGSRPSLDWK